MVPALQVYAPFRFIYEVWLKLIATPRWNMEHGKWIMEMKHRGTSGLWILERFHKIPMRNL